MDETTRLKQAYNRVLDELYRADKYIGNPEYPAKERFAWMADYQKISSRLNSLLVSISERENVSTDKVLHGFPEARSINENGDLPF